MYQSAGAQAPAPVVTAQASEANSGASWVDQARLLVAQGRWQEAEQVLGQAARDNLTSEQRKNLEAMARLVELGKQPVSQAWVRGMMEQSRNAMNAGTRDVALQCFARAAVDCRQVPELRDELMQTREFLSKTVDINQVDQAVRNWQNSQPNKNVAAASTDTRSNLAVPPSLMAQSSERASLSDVQPNRDQASALSVQAKLALDQGDVATARKLIDRALAMNVPDSEFKLSQVRPWQIAMEVERVERQRGIQPTPSSQVVQASGQQAVVSPAMADPSVGGTVRQGVFSPTSDSTRVAQAQGEVPLPSLRGGIGGTGQGELLYRQGLEALSANDRNRAIELFKQAWKYEAELDPSMRNQLKDKLLLMSANSATQSGRTPEEIVPMDAASQEQRALQQKMYREVTGEIVEAERMVANDNNPIAALERLQMLRIRVNSAQVDGNFRVQMLTMIDRVANNVQSYIDQNRVMIELDQRNRLIEDGNEKAVADRKALDKEIENMVSEFNDLIKKGMYPEAEIVAKKVGELDPNSVIASVLYQNAKQARRIHEESSLRNRKEEMTADAWNSVYESAIPMDDRNPYQMPANWASLRRMRDKYSGDGDYRLSVEEKRIREKLVEPIVVSFDKRPLSQVIKTIAEMADISIAIDQQGLAVEGMTSDTMVTLDIGSRPIQLKSALRLMLEPLHLTYVIEDDVMRITSKQAADRPTIRRTYSVKDLIIPIPNFTVDYNSGLAGALRSAYMNQGHQLLVQTQMQKSGMGGMGATTNQLASLDPSMNVLGQMGMGIPVGGPGGVPGAFGPGMPMGAGGPPLSGFPQGNPFGSGAPAGGLGGVSRADFTELIELIQNTIPGRWEEQTDTIEPFPSVLSIVVSAPQETHEAIADLLQTLRRLQNLQVTIEVRFITLTDNFFERIGVDFDFNIDDNVRAIPPEDRGPSATIGLNQDGTPTADLDLRFRQNSFRTSTPPFGNFDAGSAAQFGFAILSDLELFFLIEAAQGDTRTNVMQAPKVTMFDGQVASVLDFASRPFVISLQPIVGDFAVAQQPIIVVLNDGTQLSVQSVVSPDKRFVRMTLVPMFTRIEDADRTFTFEGTVTSKSGTNVLNPDGSLSGSKNDEEVTRTGTTVQLPTLGTTSVQTTVTVPDGGTILLGGIKRLREGRVERGVPFLNKIPYVSRLFKNVGIGRETSSLMMVVTPRIIIPEEEEERALGTSTFAP